MRDARLSIFFIVEPPDYQNMACFLAASIRCLLDEPVDLIGYCPAHRMDELDPHMVGTLTALDVDIRPMETEGRFDPPYPHGNKILATLQPRETQYSAFMDSDVLMIAKNAVGDLVRPGHVSVSAAASMFWAGQTIWTDIYAACDMEIPEDRIWLMRQRRRQMIPYFSAGLIVFPEGPVTDGGESFPEVWMRLAQRIDKADIVKKRPYLDQMSLPLAIRAAGLDWNILPEEQHFILGGQLRGEPLPEDKDIKLIHYRNFDILREVKCRGLAKDMLEKTVGVRRPSSFPVKAANDGP